MSFRSTIGLASKNGWQRSDGVAEFGSWWAQTASVMPSSDQRGEFGYSVAISNDGNTCAISAPAQFFTRGSVYIYIKSGLSWSLQTRLLISNIPTGYLRFGHDVALSADGNTCAISVQSTVIPTAYIFTRTGTTWSMQSTLEGTASGTGAFVGFDRPIALSADGNTCAFSSYINTLNVLPQVNIFTKTGSIWTEQTILNTPSTSNSNDFGFDISLSEDGNICAVGYLSDDDFSAGQNLGSVYIFTRTGATWSAPYKIFNTDFTGGSRPGFGQAVSLSGDGQTIVIGAPGYNISSENRSGNVYIYKNNNNLWTVQPTVIPLISAHSIGFSVALAANISMSVTGAPRFNPATGNGLMRIINESGPSWVNQETFSPPINDSRFGSSVAIDGQAVTYLVGSQRGERVYFYTRFS